MDSDNVDSCKKSKDQIIESLKSENEKMKKEIHDLKYQRDKLDFRNQRHKWEKKLIIIRYEQRLRRHRQTIRELKRNPHY